MSASGLALSSTQEQGKGPHLLRREPLSHLRSCQLRLSDSRGTKCVLTEMAWPPMPSFL